MTGADIGAGLSLCRAAGWNQLEADWRFFLSYPCTVAEVDGQVAGTVATLPYGWVSMLLVSPAYRRRGIASALLEQALRDLNHLDTVYLDATPAGEPLYNNFGFMPVRRFMRFKSEKGVVTPLPRATSAPDIDAAAALKLDRDVFGLDRSALLRDLLARCPEFAFVSHEGFILGRPGFHANHLGPVVANDTETARSLIESALTRHPDRPAILDVTDTARLTENWLRSVNFRAERSLVRMYCGATPVPGDPSRQFAIAGPEFG